MCTFTKSSRLGFKTQINTKVILELWVVGLFLISCLILTLNVCLDFVLVFSLTLFDLVLENLLTTAVFQSHSLFACMVYRLSEHMFVVPINP